MNLIDILLWTSIFGFILVSIILLRRSTSRGAALFLAAFYFIFSVFCLQTFIIEVGLLPKMSWFYGWPLQLYALIPSVIYFYFISIFNDGFRWKPIYLILFAPWLVSFTDVILFYSNTADFRAKIIDDAIRYPAERFDAVYGLFSIKIHYLLRYITGLLAMAFILPRLISFLKIQRQENSKRILNRWLSVLWILVSLVSLLWLIWILHLMGVKIIPVGGFLYQFLIYIFHVLVLLIGVVPIYFPTVLYGFPLLSYYHQKSNEKRHSFEDEPVILHTETKYGLVLDDIRSELKESESELLFLKAEFDQTMLANRLRMPVHHLSYILNQHFNTSFSTYRNQLRIDYACRCILEGYLETNTIEALAGHCGYSSRSAFTKIFKTITGTSPSSYHTDHSASSTK